MRNRPSIRAFLATCIIVGVCASATFTASRFFAARNITPRDSGDLVARYNALDVDPADRGKDKSKDTSKGDNREQHSGGDRSTSDKTTKTADSKTTSNA